MDSKPYTLLILSISSLLLLSSARAHCASRKEHQSGNHLPSRKAHHAPFTGPMTKICDHTDYKALCLSTVAPLLHGKVDLVSIVQVMIKACLEKTRLAMEIAKKLPDDGSIDVCLESYDSAISDLESSPDALAHHDYHTVSTRVSAVISNAETCKDGGAGPGEEPSTPVALAGVNENIQQLASNILAINALLK